MLVPRIIIDASDLSDLAVISEYKSPASLGVYLRINGIDRLASLSQAQEAKGICLHSKLVLLLDNLEIAALVNADGVCCDIDDDMHGRAKDVLGEDKLVGGTAHSIQDVANLFEEGMVDFVILKSYLEEDESENILGKQKAQSIIDDARIMGYNIPIILQGGINGSNAEEAMSTGAYGIMTRNFSHTETFKKLLDFPIR